MQQVFGQSLHQEVKDFPPLPLFLALASLLVSSIQGKEGEMAPEGFHKPSKRKA